MRRTSIVFLAGGLLLLTQWPTAMGADESGQAREVKVDFSTDASSTPAERIAWRSQRLQALRATANAVAAQIAAVQKNPKGVVPSEAAERSEDGLIAEEVMNLTEAQRLKIPGLRELFKDCVTPEDFARTYFRLSRQGQQLVRYALNAGQRAMLKRGIQKPLGTQEDLPAPPPDLATLQEQHDRLIATITRLEFEIEREKTLRSDWGMLKEAFERAKLQAAGLPTEIWTQRAAQASQIAADPQKYLALPAPQKKFLAVFARLIESLDDHGIRDEHVRSFYAVPKDMMTARR